MESTHLGSICLYYVTSISSPSFSQPLLQTFTAVPPATSSPTPSNLRQFSDNYSLLEEMWLAVGAASWVGKTAGKKKKRQGDFNFPCVFWTQRRATLAYKQHRRCSSNPFRCLNVLPPESSAEVEACSDTILFPFPVSRSLMCSHKENMCSR